MIYIGMYTYIYINLFKKIPPYIFYFFTHNTLSWNLLLLLLLLLLLKKDKY
jgi:hypothetical protein